MVNMDENPVASSPPDKHMNKEDRRMDESGARGLESVEQLGASVQNSEKATVEAKTGVCSIQPKQDNNNLAINAHREEILDRIKHFSVVIIEGPTGCGKTTQVPQWILDNCNENGEPCNIIVAQPRRIAAISIAKRVARERNWNLGETVGYQIADEHKISADTRILYVTNGVLLQKLVSSGNSVEYTHIVLDEAHERGQDMDFVLLIVKRHLDEMSSTMKVLLMSATFNRQAFLDYFPNSTAIQVARPDSMFKVKIFYLNHLEDFGPIVQRAAPMANPAIAPEMHHLVIKLLNHFENLDKQEYKYEDRSQATLPSVLIFLPGVKEIEDLSACLNDLTLRKKLAGDECAKYKWLVLPLHSAATAEEQASVFEQTPLGYRHIILATNIAESSITVPGVKYVLDYGLVKGLVTDETSNLPSVQLSWASKNNCEQRAGRAGRVMDGRVYRLVTDKFYDKFPQEIGPEMLRCPLERTVLLAKKLNIGPPAKVLAKAMDPPHINHINRTILVLKELGALKRTCQGEHMLADGDMTPLGRLMSKLPLDVRLSKLIMLGHIFDCLEESIIMAAAMSVKNIFCCSFRDRLHAFNSKLIWANGSTSDCIALLNLYKEWKHLRQQGYFNHPDHNEYKWARRFYVQVRGLRELGDMVRDLTVRLSKEGINLQQRQSPWDENELSVILKVSTIIRSNVGVVGVIFLLTIPSFLIRFIVIL